METKACRKCGESKPLDAFSWRYGKPINDCKACVAANTRAYYQAHRDEILVKVHEHRQTEQYQEIRRAWVDTNRDRLNTQRRERAAAKRPPPPPPPTEHTCPRCRVTQPLDAFTLLAAGRRDCYCKPCRAAYRQEWIAAHKDRVYTYYRTFYLRVRNTPRDTWKAWQEANPEKYREIVRQSKRRRWAAGYRPYIDPEKRRAWARRYYQQHPERIIFHAQRRRALIRQLPHTLTRAEWQAIKARHDYRCLMCGKQEPEIKLTLDHIVPVVQGGGFTADNIQPLCRSCNSRKHAKVLDLRPALPEAG